MDIYGPVFRSTLFPLWETHVRRRPVLQRLRLLERTQWLSPAALHELQSAMLARLVEHAARNVPLYRDRFRDAGLAPDAIGSVEDLAKLPILRRDDVRAAGLARASTVPPLPTIRKQTRGTTGEPLLFGLDPDAEHWRRAARYRGYAWAGYQPGDRALHFWGAPPPAELPWPTRLKEAVDQRLHRDRVIHCAVTSDAALRAVAGEIRARRPRVLICYAQAGAELARFVEREQLRSWPEIPVICGAEHVTPRDRADLERAFGPVFDTYGCGEIMMIAGECAAHEGLHVAMESVVVEIVVTEDGRPRPAREGETGEVVLTDLHNFGMPFIRYANGDIATAGSAARCPCGRTLPRIHAVGGHLSETLRDAAGSAVSGIALSNLFVDVSAAVRQFQAVQHRDRSVTIRVVQAQALPASALARIRGDAARLLAGIDVRVELVPDLPHSAAGKHHLVVVEREG
jgi:phenylacetate-CoA ligase